MIPFVRLIHAEAADERVAVVPTMVVAITSTRPTVQAIHLVGGKLVLVRGTLDDVVRALGGKDVTATD